MKKRYWTREAARKLGVDPRTLRKWVRDGVGPEHTTFNERLYFTEEALDAFVSARTKSEAK